MERALACEHVIKRPEVVKVLRDHILELAPHVLAARVSKEEASAAPLAEAAA